MKWNGILEVPLNINMEIPLLFIALLCMILVVKRKIIGALLYLLSYGMYFGVDVVNNIQNILSAMEGSLDINAYMNLFMSFIGVILPISVMFDLLLDKNRKAHPKDKQIGSIPTKNLTENWMTEQIKTIIEITKEKAEMPFY